MPDVTRSLMGDPQPGRTPWSSPQKPVKAKERPISEIRAAALAIAPPEGGGESAIGITITEEVERVEVAGNGTGEDGCAVKAEGLCPKDQPTPAVPLGLRPVEAVSIFGLDVSEPKTGGPIFEWVDPATLLINADYQRQIGNRGAALIRKIIENWDWARFKPPVCSMGEDGLEVIDGQHTAISAASHPLIETIPVMIVETPDVGSRASAFIGHNRDRLGVTQMQVHRAAVTAGEDEAVTIEQVCARAGVRLLSASQNKWAVGETVAIAGIAGLVKRRHAAGARSILDILVKGGAAPVTANGIKAVEMIMTDPEYAEADPDYLPDAIRALSEEIDKEAGVFAATHCIPVWKAMGIAWFKKCRKRRKAP